MKRLNIQKHKFDIEKVNWTVVLFYPFALVVVTTLFLLWVFTFGIAIILNYGLLGYSKEIKNNEIMVKRINRMVNALKATYPQDWES